MRKIIKKVGRAIAITFTQDEQKAYGIAEGKFFDIELAEYNNKFYDLVKDRPAIDLKKLTKKVK